MKKTASPPSILPAIKRHQLSAAFTFLAVSLGSVWLGFKLSPQLYQSSVRLIVAEKEVGISSVGQALTESNAQVPGRAADPVATQAELVESPAVLQRAIKNLHSDSNTRLSTSEIPSLSELQEALKVKVVPATNILEISLKSQSPEVAAALLNKLAEAAVQENTNSIRVGAKVLREFLEREVAEQEAELRAAENAQRRFQERSSIVSLADQSKSLVESTAALETEERALRSQLQDANTQRQLMQQVIRVNSPAQAYIAARISQDETLKSLQGHLSNLEVAIVDARSRLGDRHPDLLALLQKRDELRDLYSRQLASVVPGATGSAANAAPNALSQDLMARYITSELARRGLESRLRTVQSDLGRLQSRISQIPAVQQSLADLDRRRARAEGELSLLKDKLQEARIAEGQLLSNTRVLGTAVVPSAPVAPKPLAIVVLGIVVGLLCAAALIALLELLDTSLRNPSDTESALGLPIVGEIPRSSPAKSSSELERFLDNPEQVEPYRVLLKTLEAKVDRDRPVLLCSSSVAGEGKSSVVRHLAAVAASLNTRTLLIDADLRHPTQHELLDDAAAIGLAEVVAGKASLLEAVQPTAVSNLFVLPAGLQLNRPSTTIEMLLKTPLLLEAIAHYDLVLLDTPPVSVCTDAVTLSRAADGIFLVVRLHSTPRPVVLDAITKWNKMETLPIELVTNETVLPSETKPPVLPVASSVPALPSIPLSIQSKLNSRV